MSGNGTDAQRQTRLDAGVTLVELMVALAIGSFLIIGAVQIATQSRHAFRVNESIARVQETAQFAMDTIEADLHMAGNWGLYSRGVDIKGRATAIDPDPKDLLPTSGPLADCGAAWALDLANPVESSDNDYALGCAAQGGERADSDTLTVRRGSVAAVTGSLENGRVYVQTTRNEGALFADATVPASLASPDPDTSRTHRLIVNTYYVAADSELIPGVPTLRRKTLAFNSGNPTVVDLEVAPGIENLQVQLGIDLDGDNAVDCYVNGSGILQPGSTVYDPNARALTARVWLVVRSVDRELGLVDERSYDPGNATAYDPDDVYRRIQVSKTILLRNQRT